MAYIILGDNFSFPDGDAATNRAYTYAKGFLANNKNVAVICFKNDYKTNVNGEIEGIRYYHPINQSKRNEYFLIRNWYKVVKYYNAYSLVRKLNKSEKTEAIIVYTKLPVTHIFSWFLARMFGTLLIIENSEHPLRYHRHGFLKKLTGELSLLIELKTLDGILLITQNLIDFYKARLKGERKILHVPSTVDPTRFLQPKTSHPGYKYIGYFGSINFDRDNVDLLIKAFAKIHSRYPEINLILGGIYGDEEKKLVEDLVKQLGIESEVHLLKYLPREEVVQYIINAYILVMVRRDDPDTNSSFPCKLTEYLATGNPVITVKVGEIPNYLSDGVNAFLINPGDIDGLSGKLDTVLSDFTLSLKVAQKGKELTDTVFNYRYQAKRIIEFIDKIK